MENVKSKMFSLSKNDVVRGLVMAVITGFALPILIAIQTPEFNIATVAWQDLLNAGLNGAVLGFTTYIFKNFFSSEDGKFGGVI